MRESFTYGSVGRAPGNRCLYPEPGWKSRGVFRINIILCKTLHLPILLWLFRPVTSTLIYLLSNIQPYSQTVAIFICNLGHWHLC